MGGEMRDLLDAIEAERERADRWEHEADILKFERDEERERANRLERDAAFWEGHYYRSAGVSAEMTAELDLADRRRAALAKLLAWVKDAADDEAAACEFFVAMANGKAADRLRDLQAANRGAMRMHAELSAWREYAQTCEAALRAVVDEVQS